MRGNTRSRLLSIAFVAVVVAATVGACGEAATPSPSPTGTPSPAITGAPSVEPTPSPEPTAEPTIYVVRRGDTLIAIAAKFEITLEALRAANPQVTDPRKMRVGEKLVIPAP